MSSSPPLLHSLGLLVSQQLLGRLLSFLLNVWVARRLSTEAVGVASVNLVLQEALLLHLCREPLRRVSLRFRYTSLRTLTQHLHIYICC